MMLGKCYKAFTSKKKSRMESELTCQAEGNSGTLAKPTTLMHLHFLVELFKEADQSLSSFNRPDSRYWTGFLKEIDGMNDPFGMFTQAVRGRKQGGKKKLTIVHSYRFLQ